MTIRKLTVAAAIAVGIATCSFNTANAACPCEQKPVVTQTPCACEDLPVVTKTKEELLKDDIIPFMDAIKNGEEVIMIGHLAVPSITGDNTPASLSRKIITDLLKNELGFKGLVITDALNMGALTNNYTQDEVYIKAINAGVDILLMPNGSKDALNTIRDAVNKGMISEDTINNSVRKILTLKYKYIEDDYDEYLDSSQLNSKAHQKIVNKVVVE